jgi:protein-L-isoaspartate(D-aspartate) O-methyltransferase
MKEFNTEEFLAKRGLIDMPDERAQMVEELRKAGHSENVLEVMSLVPRHAFAPSGLWRLGYAMHDLWGEYSFLHSPQTIAKMLEALQLNDGDKVLEYGTGSGYLTVLLSFVTARVYTVEHDVRRLWLSSDAFRELGVNSIKQKESNWHLGWSENAPYDRIIVPWALPMLLNDFVNQLVPTGIILAPVGQRPGPYRLTRLTMGPKGSALTDLGSCSCPPLFGVWGQLQEENTTPLIPEVSPVNVSAWDVWAA